MRSKLLETLLSNARGTAGARTPPALTGLLRCQSLSNLMVLPLLLLPQRTLPSPHPVTP